MTGSRSNVIEMSSGARASTHPRGTAAGTADWCRLVLAGALVALVGIVAASPAQAQATPAAQEEARRRKQIEVFERLLTETLHEYVDARVSANDRTVGDGDADARTRNDGLIVRVAAASPAHGVYLDGYGVIFSVRTPQVSVIPRSFQVRLSEPLEVYGFGPAANGNLRRINTGIIEFRAGRIRQSLRDLEDLLEHKLEQGADSELTDLHLRQIEDMRAMLAPLSRGREPAPETPERQERVDTAEQGRDEDHATARRHAAAGRGFYQSVLELQRSARQVLERSHQRLSAAVNEAAIETLAQYGSVIKGLDSDDRISVLIFTPPRWAFGPTRHGDEQQDEYVISVRYKDIRDYDNQKIDLAEFRSRVRIHSRLGTVIELSPQQR